VGGYHMPLTGKDTGEIIVPKGTSAASTWRGNPTTFLRRGNPPWLPWADTEVCPYV